MAANHAEGVDPMPAPADKLPPAARRPKKMVVGDRVPFALDMLTPDERQAVELAISSWDNFRRLTTDPRGVGSAGGLRVVRVTPTFRLLYRETPTRVTVLGLVNEGAMAAFDVQTYPVPEIPGKRPAGQTTGTRP